MICLPLIKPTGLIHLRRANKIEFSTLQRSRAPPHPHSFHGDQSKYLASHLSTLANQLTCSNINKHFRVTRSLASGSQAPSETK